MALCRLFTLSAIATVLVSLFGGAPVAAFPGHSPYQAACSAGPCMDLSLNSLLANIAINWDKDETNAVPLPLAPESGVTVAITRSGFVVGGRANTDCSGGNTTATTDSTTVSALVEGAVRVAEDRELSGKIARAAAAAAHKDTDQ